MTARAPLVYRGLAASPGRAMGVVWVLRRTDGAQHIPPSSILVARIIHPHMAPLMHRVAGVVVEEGALLQHATVLAREFGVPAVVGFEGATEMLHDGDTIAITGETGEVLVWKSADDEASHGV